MLDLKEYKLSKYNIYYQDKSNLKLLNGISRCILEFENVSKEGLLKKIATLTNEEINYLIENYVIVPHNLNEYDFYLKKFFNNRKLEKELSLTIGFTFNCNFNCSYCIQRGNYNTKYKLSINQLNDIINWIIKAITEYDIETININYFGGEPTLNIDGVLYFAKEIKNVCNKYKLNLYQQIVTNGYALNLKTIKKMIELDIHDFQITIDGLQEKHNNRRSKGFDSFSKIIENIIDIINENGNIYLLHVFDISNYNSAIDLVNFFDELSKKHNKIKEKIMFNFVPTIQKDSNKLFCNEYIKGHELDLTKKSIEAFKIAKEKGFDYVNFLDIGQCFRQAQKTVLIAPNFELYKCYGIFGNEKYSIANLKNVSFKEFLVLAEDFSLANGFAEICEDCEVVPFCRGGCQFSASELNNGEYGHPYCEKDILLAQINGFLVNNLG